MNKLLNIASLAALGFAVASPACFGQHYQVTQLVANNSGKTPDPNLVNPWGLSRSSGSPWWVSDAGTGLSTLYTGAGSNPGLVVAIQGPTSGKNGTPTGTIANGNKAWFLIAPGFQSQFLFATAEGTIAGWNGGYKAPKGGVSTTAYTVAKGKKGSSYLGLTSATVDGTTYLYAANAGLGAIDVFDTKFKPVTFAVDAEQGTPFNDDLLPNGYVPYNVQAIGNDIVVTYTSFTGKPGDGYVDIYSSKGYLKTHLDHGDWLNDPWAVALAPTDFGTYSHALLIGNFANGEGDASTYGGTIAAYDLATGRYLGELEDSAGKWLSIQGLWALSPGNTGNNLDPAAAPAAAMYFTAGPNGGKDGLFGYITATASDLVQGNDQ